MNIKAQYEEKGTEPNLIEDNEDRVTIPANFPMIDEDIIEKRKKYMEEIFEATKKLNDFDATIDYTILPNNKKLIIYLNSHGYIANKIASMMGTTKSNLVKRLESFETYDLIQDHEIKITILNLITIFNMENYQIKFKNMMYNTSVLDFRYAKVRPPRFKIRKNSGFRKYYYQTKHKTVTQKHESLTAILKELMKMGYNDTETLSKDIEYPNSVFEGMLKDYKKCDQKNWYELTYRLLIFRDKIKQKNINRKIKTGE